MTDSKELHYRYNLIYPGSILIAAIVILITVKWGAVQGLVDYITFGLTLTSLFLALIAIFYAIISNTNLSKHLGNLGSATDSMTKTTASLGHISDILDDKLAELPDLIRGVEKKVDLTREDIAQGTKQQKIQEVEVDKEEDTPPTIDMVSVIKRFLGPSPFSGISALYTAQLAHKTKKPFNMETVWEGTSVSVDYGLAYITAASCIGIFGFTNKDGILNVTAMTEDLPNLRGRLDAWLIYQHKEEPSRWDFEEYTKKWIKPIEDYFKD